MGQEPQATRSQDIDRFVLGTKTDKYDEVGPLITSAEAEVLRRPFTDDAYSSYKKGTELTTLGATYVYERLQEAFGLGMVRVEGMHLGPVRVEGKTYTLYDGVIRILREFTPEEKQREPKGVAYPLLTRFVVPLHGAWVVTPIMDLTESLKSVVTNTVSKAFNTFFGGDMPLFKGLIEFNNGKIVRHKDRPAVNDDPPKPPVKIEQQRNATPSYADMKNEMMKKENLEKTKHVIESVLGKSAPKSKDWTDAQTEAVYKKFVEE